MIIYICIYNIAALIIIGRFESTLLLKYANPCQNLTFQRSCSWFETSHVNVVHRLAF